MDNSQQSVVRSDPVSRLVGDPGDWDGTAVVGDCPTWGSYIAGGSHGVGQCGGSRCAGCTGCRGGPGGAGDYGGPSSFDDLTAYIGVDGIGLSKEDTNFGDLEGAIAHSDLYGSGYVDDFDVIDIHGGAWGFGSLDGNRGFGHSTVSYPAPDSAVHRTGVADSGVTGGFEDPKAAVALRVAGDPEGFKACRVPGGHTGSVAFGARERSEDFEEGGNPGSHGGVGAFGLVYDPTGAGGSGGPVGHEGSIAFGAGERSEDFEVGGSLGSYGGVGAFSVACDQINSGGSGDPGGYEGSVDFGAIGRPEIFEAGGCPKGYEGFEAFDVAFDQAGAGSSAYPGGHEGSVVFGTEVRPEGFEAGGNPGNSGEFGVFGVACDQSGAVASGGPGGYEGTVVFGDAGRSESLGASASLRVFGGFDAVGDQTDVSFAGGTVFGGGVGDRESIGACGSTRNHEGINEYDTGRDETCAGVSEVPSGHEDTVIFGVAGRPEGLGACGVAEGNGGGGIFGVGSDQTGILSSGGPGGQDAVGKFGGPQASVGVSGDTVPGEAGLEHHCESGGAGSYGAGAVFSGSSRAALVEHEEVIGRLVTALQAKTMGWARGDQMSATMNSSQELVTSIQQTSKTPYGTGRVGKRHKEAPSSPRSSKQPFSVPSYSCSSPSVCTTLTTSISSTNLSMAPGSSPSTNSTSTPSTLGPSTCSQQNLPSESPRPCTSNADARSAALNEYLEFSSSHKIPESSSVGHPKVAHSFTILTECLVSSISYRPLQSNLTEDTPSGSAATGTSARDLTPAATMTRKTIGGNNETSNSCSVASKRSQSPVGEFPPAVRTQLTKTGTISTVVRHIRSLKDVSAKSNILFDSVHVQNLLDAGIDVNGKYDNDLTLLHCAVIIGQSDMVTLLFSRGANIHVRDYKGATALHRAATYDFSGKLTTQLLAAGANVNCLDFTGSTPLHYAVISVNAEATKELLLGGADVEQENYDGKSPLMLATLETMRQLLTPLPFVELAALPNPDKVLSLDSRL